MPHLSYKNRLIIASAQVDDITGFWIPVVEISWVTDGQRRSHTIESPSLNFARWQEAEEHLFDLAKAWIDRSL
jgi:hypothetical protein